MQNISMFQLFFIFIITIAIAYLFGLTLVNVVDKRLTEIKLNIPKQDVIISYPDGSPVEQFANRKGGSEDEDDLSNMSKEQLFKNMQTNIVKYNVHEFNNGKIKSNSKYYDLDREYVDQMKNNNNKDLIEGYGKTIPEWNFKQWTDAPKEKRICIKNHEHVKDGKKTECTYGITNYADPKDMSNIDLKIFMLNYPENMTLQDYINWLYCFVGKEHELPYNHLQNLEKLKKGITLVEEEGVLPPPGYYFPPKDAKDYFDQLYNKDNGFNVAAPLNSNTSSMLGANCDDYSEFTQNFDVYGTTGELRNPDIWEKKTAKELYEYTFPKDSNFLNETEEYNKYRIKKVEI